MDLIAALYKLLPLVSFVLNIFLISLVLRRDWQQARNRVFALLLLALGLWGFALFGMRSSPNPQGADAALAWEKMALVTVLGVAVLFLHFTVLYTRIKPHRAILPGFYLAWAVFTGLSLTNQVVDRVVDVALFGGHPGWEAKFTSLGVLYLAAIHAASLLGINNLIRTYRTTRSPEERNRLLYMVVGGVLFLVGVTSDFLFPEDILFYPFGMLANLYFTSLTTVALLKHRLMELRVALRSGVTYTLVGTFIAGVYGGAFALFHFLFRAQSSTDRLWASIGAATVVAIALQPALARIQQLADRWLYRERYDHLKVLERFSRATKDITNLQSLSEVLTNLVCKAVQAESACLLLPGPHGSHFYVASTSGLTKMENVRLEDDSPILSWLRHNEGVLSRKELGLDTSFRPLSSREVAAVEAMQAELFIPLQAKGQLTGILVVGAKLSDEDYATSDIELLRTVVDQTATAIENARLHTQEAKRLNELEQLEKLKQTLLLTVSHEIKTPLTAIKAGTEMLQLQDQASPTSPKGRLLRSINRGVERLERLVEESLDYAKMQDSNLELDLELIDLKELYEETISIATPAVRAKRQTLEVHLPELVPPVLVDRRRCERILLNLISNANKYTQPEGIIKVNLKVERTCLTTSVSDTGPGISKQEQDKLFNVYYRGEAADGQTASQSSGLGLAIAKYLVELHGGKIWLESTVGKGSTFYYSLPLRDSHESIGD
ncbi:MAG TPA: ATP-binding protein [Dehalococcoidia bacterium]|nr:ATP-binding protein [Dehalococcoidia bacterium]